jgi:hypothetical protein
MGRVLPNANRRPGAAATTLNLLARRGLIAPTRTAGAEFRSIHKRTAAESEIRTLLQESGAPIEAHGGSVVLLAFTPRAQAYLSGMVLVGVPVPWSALSPNETNEPPPDTLVALPSNLDPDMYSMLPGTTTIAVPG